MESLLDTARESDVVVLAGIVAFLVVVFKIVGILRTCYTYMSGMKVDYRKFADGGYALITGGAGGIGQGKATAVEFAKLGINLYLMDYNKDLLEETSKMIAKTYPKISVKTKTIDLRRLIDEKVYNELCAELDSMKIGILFNCAGIAEYKAFRFNDNTHTDLTAMNEINATVPALLYRAVLPQMVVRRNGLMLAMASAAAMSPQPVIPAYGATKSYILQLSRSLQNQFPYEYSGVYFHAFQPQFVETPMTAGRLGKMGELRWMFPTVDYWVKNALKTVMANNDGFSAGCLAHEFLVWLQINLTPIVDKINRMKPPSQKFKNDERFKYSVAHEENSKLFEGMMRDGALFGKPGQ